MNLKHLTLVLALSFIVLVTGTSHPAWAVDDCDNSGDGGSVNSPVTPSPGDSPTISGACVGGFNCNAHTAGQFQHNYQNTANRVTQQRGMSKWQTFMDADKIDAKAHYCFGAIQKFIQTIQAAFDVASADLSLRQILILAIEAVLTAVAIQALEDACMLLKASLGGIVGSLGTLTNGLFNGSLLCIPMPKLSPPHFGIAKFNFFGHNTCKGLGFSANQLMGAGQPNNNQNVYWKLWGRSQPQ